MSIRIIPAAACVWPYFDDGIVPLTAKAIDHEDCRPLPWITPQPSLFTPYQDEPFKLVVATPLDDDYGFAWPTPKAAAAAWQYFEDDTLPNAKNFPGDESIGIATIVTPDRIGQLMAFMDDDVLAFTTGFTPLFRKTLSSIGGRIGQRQLQG